MSEVLVAVLDGSRARLFTLEQAALPEYESGPNLVERQELANPSKELPGRDLWANVKTGRNQGSAGRSHAYDDHRQSHVEEFERRFIQTVAADIVNLAQTHGVQRIVLVAEAQTLGLVREALSSSPPKNFTVQELGKDLSKLKPLELHEYLAAKDLLPVRRKAPGRG